MVCVVLTRPVVFVSLYHSLRDRTAGLGSKFLCPTQALPHPDGSCSQFTLPEAKGCSLTQPRVSAGELFPVFRISPITYWGSLRFFLLLWAIQKQNSLVWPWMPAKMCCHQGSAHPSANTVPVHSFKEHPWESPGFPGSGCILQFPSSGCILIAHIGTTENLL